MLDVSQSTRALLENVVDAFDAPIRYAVAYGSGVFEQDGYTQEKEKPMLDFLFAVTHADHFHSINMHQFPGHYPLHTRLLGSDYVARASAVGPGVWFNAYVPVNGVTIKYGVTTVDALCTDLLHWDNLYLAGRMHKPVRIIRDDARVRLNQQVNLVSAARAALLTLPERFTEAELYTRIAGFSYSGDPRMVMPMENRSKVGNIVRKQHPQFRDLYGRLVTSLPGVRWAHGKDEMEQEVTTMAREKHLRKLPRTLVDRLKRRYGPLEDDEQWARVAADEQLGATIQKEIASIVRWPATVQTAKSILSNGPIKSIKYGAAKLGKWWKS